VFVLKAEVGFGVEDCRDGGGGAGAGAGAGNGNGNGNGNSWGPPAEYFLGVVYLGLDRGCGGVGELSAAEALTSHRKGKLSK
jgi:hypothetical protein